jgi:lambda family phage portal protein
VSSGSADYDLLPDLAILRERSRELLRNDPHAASIVGSLVDNVTGTGIKPQSVIDAVALGISPEEATKIQKACERAWHRWAPHADISRRMNFYDIQRAVMRSIVVNGESVVMPVRVDRTGAPYALALEVIEPDRLEAPGQMDQPNGRFNRRSGVELGKYGQPVGYWIRVSHPGDGTYERHSDSRHRRISAVDGEGNKQILHLMNNTRPGQTRGEPMLAPALSTFRDLGSWNEAVLVRERISACHSMFISKDDPYTTAVNRADDTVNTQRLQEIEPGMISYLAPGESVSFGNPGGGNSANYDQFVMRHLRSIGAALGLPYELVSKDFSQTNYSSARAALLEARRVFNRWQKYLIEHLCTQAYAMVIEEAWLRGEIPFSEFEKHREVITQSRWVPPTFGWVDPRKEVEAATIAIQTGLSSLAIEAAAQGRDWEQVLEQQAREQQLRQELGLLQSDSTDPGEVSDE